LFDALRPLRETLGEPAFRWIDPRNYHVTLRFFGNLSREEVARAARSIEPIAAASPPIDCRAGPVMALPTARRPSVIALGLESGGALERLAERANAALESGFGSPDKPFKAHLTIVRCRRGARVSSRPNALDLQLHFDRVALYESSRAPTGPRYAVLEEFALGV
jgi:RNA 2',3'-cyclic 3'-phosphodiesterase